MRRLTERLADERGQMAVELAIVFPVVIIIAVIAVNALTYLSDCAAFDRLAHDAVRVYAASPAYGQDLNQSIASVSSALDDSLTLENEKASVSAYANAAGLTTFEMTLTYEPTLFGLAFRGEVFGVPLPSLKHSTSIVVDIYKPGMFF